MNMALTNSVQLKPYRMPGEHESHQAVWMGWPHRPDNWRCNGTMAQQAFIDVATTIAEKTPVTMIVNAQHYQQARAQLPETIEVIELPYDDCWLRDIGATYVVNENQQRKAIDWQFNAWGGDVDGLYSPWDNDDAIAQKMAAINNDLHYRAPLVLEGGSIHVDGEGTLYTTEECLLHESRNPDLSKQQIELQLKETLGVDKVIWLKQGLYNDETNGHVDNIMHVVKPGEVILTYCDDPTDPQYAISQAAYKQLSESQDAQGRNIVVHKLPMPGPLYITEEEAQGIQATEGMERSAGERLAASYANFLVSNGQVIYPLLDPKKDKLAYSVLQNAFPDHTIKGIEAREILLGGGNIHCITQQIPLCK